MISAPSLRVTLLSALAIGLTACATGESGEPLCTTVGSPHPLATELREASGVAASRTHPGAFYTHNDSGGDAIVFALDSSGAITARLRLTNARNVDWEDIATAPCPQGGGSCIWVADIGDNQAGRDIVSLYVVSEPTALRGSADLQAVRYDLTFPDGARDAEALFVTPSRRAYILSKGGLGPVTLYRSAALGPDDTGGAHLLERVQSFGSDAAELPDQVTGAAISEDGQRIAIRTYTHLQLHRWDRERLRPLLPGPGVALEPLGEPQGEGVALVAGDTIALTSEEGPQAIAPRLTLLVCPALGAR